MMAERRKTQVLSVEYPIRNRNPDGLLLWDKILKEGKNVIRGQELGIDKLLLYH